MADYNFGEGKFSNELWIANKRVFINPIGVNVEFVTPGVFDWVFSDSTGREVKTVRQSMGHGGWTSINFASLGLHDDYMIGFRNFGPGTIEIKQGNVMLP